MDPIDYDYDLPEDRIAQEPAPERDAARMLRIDRAARPAGRRPFRDLTFRDLPTELRPGDLVVLNDTRVIPARLRACNPRTGGKIEFLCLRENPDGSWDCLARPARRARPGSTFGLERDPETRVTVAAAREGGEVCIAAAGTEPVAELIRRLGEVPLPPYIRRRDADQRLDSLDRVRYQTVFARAEGAVAAPTAGLHFTADTLHCLEQRGIETAVITLHVGPGTFQPVRAPTLEEHRMHEERYEIPPETAEALVRARADNRRIVAIGTTVVRALEAAVRAGDGTIRPGAASTDLFIYPPYDFRVVGALLTNFHLPRSTLLMLVAAFTGRETVLEAYRHAVAAGYRFYSYGDCMLIT